MTCMDRYVKHARLIKAIYPAPPETAPKSNELSYLVFYASSRPAKLTKVGAFLEKRCEKDVRYRRVVENLVTLAILDALMGACHKDFNLFSKSIIKIILMMLDTKDMNLMSQASHTFVKFCHYHNGSTLGVDTEFTASYERLVGRFCALCQETSSNAEADGMCRLIGLRAVLGVVSSEALYTSESSKQTSLVVPAILSNLLSPTGSSITGVPLTSSPRNSDSQLIPTSVTPISGNSSTNVNTSRQSLDSSEYLTAGKRFSIHPGVPPGAGAIQWPPSAIKNTCPSADDLNAMSLHTLKKIFRNASGPIVKLLLAPLFEFLDQQKKWWPSDYAVSLVRVLATSTHQQWRYLIVTEVLARLDEWANSASDDKKETTEVQWTLEEQRQNQTTLVSILSTLLTTHLSLIGISILELLNALLEHLRRTIQKREDTSNSEPAPEKQSNPEPSRSRGLEYDDFDYGSPMGDMRRGLVMAIGGLATNIYYTNQVPDIVTHLVFTLNEGVLSASSSGIPLSDLRKTVLTCIHRVFKVNSSEMSVAVEKRKARDVGHGGNEKSEKSENENVAEKPVDGVQRGEIPLDILVPSIGLLVDRDEGVRAAYASLMLTCLEPTPTYQGPVENSKGYEPSEGKKSLPRFGSRMYHLFRATLHRSLFDLANSQNASPSDYQALLNIFIVLLTRFGDDELAKSVPILLKIQSLHGSLDDTAKQRASSSLVVEYLETVAKIYKLEELALHIDSIKRHRVIHSQYSPVFLPNAGKTRISQFATLESMEKATPPSHAPYTPVGPPHIVATEISAILSKDAQLSAQDLGNKVLRDYVPGEAQLTSSHLRSSAALLLAGRSLITGALGTTSTTTSSSRIRTSRDLEELRVRDLGGATGMGTSGAIAKIQALKGYEGDADRDSNFEGEEDMSVDHLREAFFAAQVYDQEADGIPESGLAPGTSTPNVNVSDTEPDTDFQSAAKPETHPPKAAPSSVSHLLRSLAMSSSHDASRSNSSLANPPYRS